MRKFIVAPSSFKGYLKPFEVADEFSKTLAKLYPNSEIVALPLPDGGEGTLEVYLNEGYQERHVLVQGPEEEPLLVRYGLKDKRAFIESAECLSLALVKHHDPRHTTSYGIGEMIIDAIDHGADDITISLGGTCSNDGGSGMALALGARFYSAKHEFMEMHGSLLEKIERIDWTELKERISGVRFHCLSDVDNPLCGVNGASLVYGPQKGATPETAAALDVGMHHYAEIIAKALSIDYSSVPGAGAAGGLGFACLSYLGADISSGCEAIMKLNHFDEHLQGAELILFAEGKLDRQSLMGKSLSHLLSHKGTIPLMCFAGEVLLSAPELNKAGIDYAYSLKNVEETPLNKERIVRALFRVTYDAMIQYGHALARRAQNDPEE